MFLAPVEPKFEEEGKFEALTPRRPSFVYIGELKTGAGDLFS
jgi:hypothetical protein